MKRELIRIFLLLPLSASLLLGLLIPGEANGATVVVDKNDITYSPLNPAHSDQFNITVEPLFSDTEPVEDGVVLMWSLCTDEGCGIATPQVMTDNGNGTWSHVFDSFPEKNSDGLPYKDVLFYVKITYVPTGGGEESTVQTESIEVLFTEPADDDDDDDTIPTDDDDDDDDSPFGYGIILGGVIIAAGLMIYKRRTNLD
jgi:hypothetical protein